MFVPCLVFSLSSHGKAQEAGHWDLLAPPSGRGRKFLLQKQRVKKAGQFLEEGRRKSDQ